jgi:hypothetical protein
VSERLDDALLVLLTFTTADLLDDYQRRRSLDIPILIDSERDAYRRYGLRRGSFGRVWGLATIRRYAEILKPSGAGSLADMSAATEDTRQLGGDFVIAPDGTLAWGHWSVGPADRPDVDEIATAVADARRER